MSTSIILKIGGMHCEHCVAAVQAALEALPAVEKAQVNLKKATARISITSEISPDVLRQTVEAAGYELEGLE